MRTAESFTSLLAAINPAGCGENVGRWAHRAVPQLFGAVDTRRAAAEFLGGVIKELLHLEPGIDVLEIAHVELALWDRARAEGMARYPTLPRYPTECQEESFMSLLAAINPAGCGENVGRWAHRAVPQLFGAVDTRRAAAEFLGGVIKALLYLEPGIDVLEIADEV